MKKKQNFNPLQLSFFDEVAGNNNKGNNSLLDDNWHNVVDYVENEKRPNSNLKIKHALIPANSYAKIT